MATSVATTTTTTTATEASAPAPKRALAALALLAAAAAIAAVACPASGGEGRILSAPDLVDDGDSDSSLLQSRWLASRFLGAEDDDERGGMQCGDPAWFYTTEACEASKSGGGGGWGHQRKATPTPPEEPCPSKHAHPWCDTTLDPEKRAALLVAQMNLTELAEQVSCDIFAGVPSIPRLGVNAYNYIRENDHGLLWNDMCPATTMFPQAITMAGAFNRSLWHNIALASAAETRYSYVTGKQNSLFGQVNFNQFIDPRWGRGQEVPGEDPVLTSNYVKEWVPGVQKRSNTGSNLSVVASCKHYTAYSLEGAGGWPYPTYDSNRHNFNAMVPKQDLSDTHFPAYEECARQNAQGVMTAYNAVNGIPMTANTELNEDILRKKWGFSGLIVTDCGAVEDMWLRHKYVPNGTAAAWATLEGGVDVECGGTVKANVQPGMLSLLRRAVQRSFTVRFRTGEFDFKFQDEPMYDQKRHAKLAYDAAVQGAVLLKNDQDLLPLVNRETIAVVGPLKGGNWEVLGNYAAYKNDKNWSDSPNVKTVLQGLEECGLGDKMKVLKNGPYVCSATDDIIPGFHEHYFERPNVDVLLIVGGLYCQDEQTMNPDIRPQVSGTCQGGCLESEGCDRPNLDLPKGQRELIARAAEWQIPVVLAIIAGGGMDLSEVEGMDKVQSIIWLGYPGQAAGTALARMLFGLDAPSGKLSFTMYKSAWAEAIGLDDVGMRPVPDAHKPGRTYRFVNDRDHVLHSFGYGLSYWPFSYEWAEVSTTTTSSTTSSTTMTEGVDLRCGREPAGTCTGNPAEICVFDRGCSQTPPTFGGLGCNAGGAGQNCRFCGFAHFESCESVSLLAESKASIEQQVEADKFQPCSVAVKVSVGEAAKRGIKAQPSTSVLLFLVPPSNVPFEGAPIKSLAKFERMNNPAGDTLVFSFVRDDFLLSDPDGKRQFVTGDWRLEVQENAELSQTVVVEEGGCFPDE